MHVLIEAHVFAAERLHGDDTTVSILTRGKGQRGAWVYVRDDRPFGGQRRPAALFYASRDPTAEHPERHLAIGAASCKPTPTAATTASISPSSSQGASMRQSLNFVRVEKVDIVTLQKRIKRE